MMNNTTTDVARLAHILLHITDERDGKPLYPLDLMPELFAIIRRWIEAGKDLSDLEREVITVHELWREEMLSQCRGG